MSNPEDPLLSFSVAVAVSVVVVAVTVVEISAVTVVPAAVVVTPVVVKPAVLVLVVVTTVVSVLVTAVVSMPLPSHSPQVIRQCSETSTPSTTSPHRSTPMTSHNGLLSRQPSAVVDGGLVTAGVLGDAVVVVLVVVLMEVVLVVDVVVEVEVEVEVVVEGVGVLVVAPVALLQRPQVSLHCWLMSMPWNTVPQCPLPIMGHNTLISWQVTSIVVLVCKVVVGSDGVTWSVVDTALVVLSPVPLVSSNVVEL